MWSASEAKSVAFTTSRLIELSTRVLGTTLHSQVDRRAERREHSEPRRGHPTMAVSRGDEGEGRCSCPQSILHHY